MPDSEDTEFVSPKTRRKKKNVSTQESTDSGIGDSSVAAASSTAGKGKKSRASGLKVPPPQGPSQAGAVGGATGVTKHGGKKGRKKCDQRMTLESSSLSSASPASSIHSHSPVTLSPSPTPSFSSHHVSSAAATITQPPPPEEPPKDEWPDLSEFTQAAPPASPHPLPDPAKVQTHLEVEAKVLEQSSSPDFSSSVATQEEEEEEDSSYSPSVDTSSEHSASLGGAEALLPTPVIPTVATSASVSYSPMVMAGGMHCYPSPGMLSPMFGGPLSMSRPQLGGGDMSPEQYLWMQQQQLKMFIQRHQEQHERQTDTQIFYPVDPILGTPPCPLPLAGTPPGVLPPPLPPAGPPMQLPNLIQVPLLPPLLPLPRPVSPSRPLFFPPRSPHSPQGGMLPSQPLSGPPFPPPPPPPLPVHPYHMVPTLSCSSPSKSILILYTRGFYCVVSMYTISLLSVSLSICL